jgi:hypothetical protein
VATAIRASGVPIVVEKWSGDQDSRIDLGVWADEFDIAVGNPLIIEVTDHLSNRSKINSIRQQIESHLRDTNTRTALVLYRSGPNEAQDFLELSSVSVLFFPIRELLQQLQDKGFGAIVLALRNQVVHRVAA